MSNHDDYYRELVFKAKIMKVIVKQSGVIDIDEQITLLKEVCTDLRNEYKKQLKKGGEING